MAQTRLTPREGSDTHGSRINSGQPHTVANHHDDLTISRTRLLSSSATHLVVH